MSLFGSLLGDVEDDPFFGSHLRHMRQMNNMMNSLFSDPFGMFGSESPLAIMGGMGGMGSMASMASGHGAMMPFMPNMAPLNRLFSVDMEGGMGVPGSSYSSSTVIMSSGPAGKPQVYSSSSSTKIGPNGVKETRKTLEDSRTGTKKMSIGHHIGERAHVVERAQNIYSGEREESQEYINIEEDEADEFDREFQEKSGAYSGAPRGQIMPPRAAPLLALPPAPSASAPAAPSATATNANFSESSSPASRQASGQASRQASGRDSRHASGRVTKPSARRPLRTTASPLATSKSASVREIYSGSHPQRHRHKHSKNRHTAE